MATETNPVSPSRFELTGACLLLRLFLGLRLLLAGVEKFESKGAYSAENYSANMTRMAEGITSASFLPLWMTRTFAHSLGYALLLVGTAVLLGIKPRVSFFLAGLLFVGLAFGLMAVQENEGVAWLGIHVGLCAGALALACHHRFALWPDRFA